MRRWISTPVILQRWKILGVVVGLAGAFTVGLVLLTQANDRTHRVAKHANKTASALKREQARNAIARSTQIQVLHGVDVRTCLRTHRVVRILKGIVRDGIRETRSATLPDLTPRQARALRGIRARSIANDERYLQTLKRADCRSVPPLPPLHSKP